MTNPESFVQGTSITCSDLNPGKPVVGFSIEYLTTSANIMAEDAS